MIYCADVRDFAAGDRTHLFCVERNNCHCFAVERNEFNFVARAALMDENDGADIALL